MTPELEKIQSVLEEIRSLIVLVNQDKLREVKESLLQEGSVKEQIYNMCDETMDIEDMAEALGQKRNYVRSYLSRLRRDGLIKNVIKDDRQVYRQVF